MSTSRPESKSALLLCLVAVGAACYQCHSQESESVRLQKCSACHLVSYCNSACQYENWVEHKSFCRVMVAFEHFILPASVSTSRIASQIQKAKFCELALGRVLSDHEHALIVWEPGCLHCDRTDQRTRIEASTDASHILVPCPNCRLSFACTNHWAFAYGEHTQKMCAGGYDGLSQCVLNQELLEDEEWNSRMLLIPELLPPYAAVALSYRWIPAQTKSSWSSLKGATWAGAFQTQLEFEFPAARGAASMRRMSDPLSMPMTALYALELLNDGIEWTKKDILTIHVIGAEPKELYNAICFENLLHQLPAVNAVKVVMCGVHLTPTELRGGPYEIVCCPTCEGGGRKRYNEYYDVDYHTLPRIMGPRYSVPDLAIAFNSGASEPPDLAAWKKTIAFLVSRSIPSVFTAYGQEDATTDSALLAASGARLVPGLGPCRNPWGSMLVIKDVLQLRGFYSENMFLAGGFNGR
ncbi:hypothetical protein DFH09DRAFT_1025002 [Mycena vulgaris]|nr:hypothetical protein DFH09DRAFT_1025002 [Mycena vulgaris]